MNNPDFQGWATRYGVKCSDGLTIQHGAFQNAPESVPLVWQHNYSSPTNVLGHAKLTHMDEGVWVEAYVNDTDAGRHTKEIVQHGDISAFSIGANNLVKNGQTLLQGAIYEVSMVLKGANPAAVLVHSDDIDDPGFDLPDGTMIVATGELQHSEMEDDKVEYEDTLEHTLSFEEAAGDFIDSLTDYEAEVVAAILGQNSEEDSLTQSDITEEDVVEFYSTLSEDGQEMLSELIDMVEEEEMVTQSVELGGYDVNAFDNNGYVDTDVLLQSAISEVNDKLKNGNWSSFSELKHSISNQDILLPDPKLVDGIQEDWTTYEGYEQVLNSVSKLPFSRFKSMYIDMSPEDARAKGYVTGTLKVEQVLAILKRDVTPATVYKKQKMDRDTLIDITEFNVVSLIWAAMRKALINAVGQQILFGKGLSRLHLKNGAGVEVADINQKIIPIAEDDNLYTHKIIKPTGSTPVYDDFYLALSEIKQPGNKIMYATRETIFSLRAQRTTNGDFQWGTIISTQELAQALGVSAIIEINNPVNSSDVAYDSKYTALIAIMSNYAIGTDNGGEITTFDDFDINYNKYTYLIEGRMSGMMRKPKSALLITAQV